MSRIPQPSSSRRPSTTSIPPTLTTPTRPRVLNSITSTPTARTYANGSSTTLKPTVSTVRKTGSAVSLKAKTPTTPRPPPVSPAKAKPPTSAIVNSRAVSEKNPSTPSMSVREAIARKRAEAKKAQARSGESDGFDTVSSLQDALPPHVNPAQQEEDVLGRATLRETIDKARSTGDDMFLFPCNSWFQRPGTCCKVHSTCLRVHWSVYHQPCMRFI